MQLIRHLLVLASGITIGIATVISCSDSPRAVDAAVDCECPASEPPLRDRIIQRENVAIAGPSNGPSDGEGFAAASCPIDAILLSGGCAADLTTLPDIVLRESAIGGGPFPGWRCNFHNNSLQSVEVKATAICLIPAAP